MWVAKHCSDRFLAVYHIATSKSFVSRRTINDQVTSLLKHEGRLETNHPTGRLVTNRPSSLCTNLLYMSRVSRVSLRQGVLTFFLGHPVQGVRTYVKL